MAFLKDLIVRGSARIMGKIYADKFVGTATNAEKLNNIESTGFARSLGTTEFGGNNNGITTAQFILLLSSLGAFKQYYWTAKGTWSYSKNQYINDTGCGNIHLAGSIIEVFNSLSSAECEIRISTPTTGNGTGQCSSDFIYVNNGSEYSPGWRRLYSSAYHPEADKATNDSAGNNINSTYIKNLSVSGTKITCTKGNGSTFAINTQDNNTDNKVAQTAVSNNTNYPLLFAPQSSNATTSVYYDSSITVNPSTDTLNVKNINVGVMKTPVKPPLQLVYGHFYTTGTLQISLYSSENYVKIFADGSTLTNGWDCFSSSIYSCYGCGYENYLALFLFRVVGYDYNSSGSDKIEPFVKYILLSTVDHQMNCAEYSTYYSTFTTPLGNNVKMYLSGINSSFNNCGYFSGTPYLNIQASSNVHFLEISLIA